MASAGDSRSFTVTCACGTDIHTDVHHVGRTVRCRCGRTVSITRPQDDRPPAGRGTPLFSSADVAPTKGRRTRRRSGRGAGWRRINLGFLRSYAAGLARDLSGRSRPRRWGAWAALLLLIGQIGAWLLLILASETFLPATVLAYGPRFVLVLPVVPVGLFVLLAAPRALPMVLLAGLVGLGPLMGFRVNLPTGGFAPPPEVPPQSVRVLTLNAQGGQIVQQQIRNLFARLHPEVAAVTECGDALRDSLSAIPGWQVESHEDVCVASRWPLTQRDTMPRMAFVRVSRLGFGGIVQTVAFRVEHPRQPFILVTVHLPTPRKGLESLLGPDGVIPDDWTSNGTPRVRSAPDGWSDDIAINTRLRLAVSERTSVWAARSMNDTPVVVAGDFNLSVESTIYRRDWTVFDNAFEVAGFGFGYTKREGRWIRARIDHVLYAPAWFEAIGAWVGPDVGSDHRPVIADLRWVR